MTFAPLTTCDEARQWLKVAIFHTPPASDALVSGVAIVILPEGLVWKN